MEADLEDKTRGLPGEGKGTGNLTDSPRGE
jgi:hypothetical protein